MPLSSIRHLRQRTVPLRPMADDGDVPPTADQDPLGISAQTRGVAHQVAGQQDMINRSYAERDPLLAASAITGPLPDPRWAGFFQRLSDSGVTNLRGGPSPAGSTQLTGQRFASPIADGTAGDALADVQGAQDTSATGQSIEALRRRARAARGGL